MHYIIDTSWMLYRGYFSSKNIWTEFPELHFLVKKLESILSRPDAIVHLCLDGRNTKGKKLLGEAYKAGRHTEDSYNVYKGLPEFIHLLNNKRIKVYYGSEYEADELVYTLSRKLEGRKKILSGDKDLFQSLKEDVIIDNGRNFVITEESYKLEYYDKFFGIEPTKLPLFRAICGDASDSLKPPVPRFPHKLAAKLVESIDYSGNVPSKEELSRISSNFSTSEIKWVNKLIDAYDSFSINFEIMKLNVINDDIHQEYSYKEAGFSDFLKSKIAHLNSI